MAIDADAVTKSIEAMIPRMTEQVAQELRKRALDSLTSSVTYQINDEVKKYITEVILPETRKELVKHEAEFKAAALASVKGVLTEVAEQIFTKAKARLSGYDGDRVIDEVMRSVFGRIS
jgi:hypothetical protein